MATVLVTGSADGLGRETARRLVAGGNDVLLHARSEQRAREARGAVAGARDVLVADLARLDQVTAMAERASGCDVVVHNAGLGYRESRVLTDEGVEHVFAVNVLAPYVLTALMPGAQRLIYLSSGMHARGGADVDDLAWQQRSWNPSRAYSDSKLLDVVLAFAVARRRPEVASNAVDPGWIATKMGGAGAPGTLSEGTDGQVWLAESEDPRALESGFYYRQRQRDEPQAAARDEGVQDALLSACHEVSGIALA